MSRENSKRFHVCPRCGSKQGCLQGKTPKLDHQCAKKLGGCGYKQPPSGIPGFTGKTWVKDAKSATGFSESTTDVKDAKFVTGEYTKEEMEARIAKLIGAPAAPAPAQAPAAPAQAPAPQAPRVPVKTK